MLKLESLSQPFTAGKIALKKRSFAKALGGATISILVLSGLLSLAPRSRFSEKLDYETAMSLLTNSELADLSEYNPRQQTSLLQELAATELSYRTGKLQALDRARARYLLAVKAIKQYKPQKALGYLESLEIEYSVLAPYILQQKVQAHLQLKQRAQAEEIAKKLLADYPNEVVIPQVYSLLGRSQDGDSEYLLSKFPYHPVSQQIARKALENDPQKSQALLAIATYERNSGDEMNQIRDRLITEHPEVLTADDWQVIADGYWNSGDRRKAADAYKFALSSPQNLYRIARGYHRNGNFASARRAYQKLYKEYHDAQATGKGLLYLARLSTADEAIKYLEIVIAKFPEHTAEALLQKAKIYERYEKLAEARADRELALTKYPDSAAVLKYRWQKAYQLAASGDYSSAWQWAEALTKTKSLASDPKAIFWAGKWAQEAANHQGATQAFETVLELHPQSYWAWRAAVKLGHDVGDFNSLRSLQPPLKLESHYELLPFGSPVLQELYLLGQYQDAWIRLQEEITNPQQLTVAQQFTEGLLLVKQGKIRPGIQNIWNLAQREYPLEQEQWRTLRQKESYWYGLFPFPYFQTIMTDARQQAINPLLTVSVMRKESTFDPKIDSHVGAVGLMQIIPHTADWIARQEQINDYDLTHPTDNIQMGTWYLAHNHQRYQDNSLHAIASYNAGTGNVNRWVQNFSQDPDRFVEQIPFVETKDYVEGVFGNYWNYLRLYGAE